jgi:hypothetical protein
MHHYRALIQAQVLPQPLLCQDRRILVQLPQQRRPLPRLIQLRPRPHATREQMDVDLLMAQPLHPLHRQSRVRLTRKRTPRDHQMTAPFTSGGFQTRLSKLRIATRSSLGTCVMLSIRQSLSSFGQYLAIFGKVTHRPRSTMMLQSSHLACAMQFAKYCQNLLRCCRAPSCGTLS